MDKLKPKEIRNLIDSVNEIKNTVNGLDSKMNKVVSDLIAPMSENKNLRNTKSEARKLTSKNKNK